MKQLKTLILAVATVALAATTSFAADTGTVNVSATVLGTCLFNTDTASMAFGVLDPATPLAANATATLVYTCSTGTPYTIASASANGGTLNSTTLATPESITYSYAVVDAGTGTGTGLPTNLAFNGTIAAGAYSTNTADVYTDVINVTITP